MKEQTNHKKDYHKQNHQCPFTTTDIIIEYNDGSRNGIILVTRKNPPYGLAVPGGFAELGLTLEENAKKEAKEETGLEIIIENPEKPLCVHSHPNRDPRGHMISNTYIARGYGTLRAGDDAKTARLYTINEVKGLIQQEKLVFDHARILEKYLRHKGYYK
ncbi:hypothetical protein AYK26_05950 [Euryarchaeota archaeon SM23-78]|nr:MAG: hypothetical protein AYK26_05950 [Euryarchaeota archaeon SM23-78]MBW3000591.1 NUDIX hydrolase [Candidatus Woesearchaeota archaeon]